MRLSEVAARSRFAVGGRVLPGRTVEAALTLFRTPARHPAKGWEEQVEASATRGTTASGMSYLRWTPAQVQCRVLAIHGWSGRATQWGPLAAELLAHGVETIAVDAPAHGATPGHEADPVIFAAALTAAAQELGPFDAGIGHSMGGGALALAMARGLQVGRAVLIASPAAFGDVATDFAHRIGLPPRLLPRFLQRVGQATGMSIEDADITRAARGITVPALIVHDRDDLDTSYLNAERISAAWADSSILITRGLGHRRLLRDPLVMDEIIDFVVD